MVNGGEMTGDNETRIVCNTHFSICDRNFVSKMPRVLSRSDILPLNKRPLAVKSISTFRTISPRYIPLIIFSYLWKEIHKLKTFHSSTSQINNII